MTKPGMSPLGSLHPKIAEQVEVNKIKIKKQPAKRKSKRSMDKEGEGLDGRRVGGSKKAKLGEVEKGRHRPNVQQTSDRNGVVTKENRSIIKEANQTTRPTRQPSSNLSTSSSSPLIPSHPLLPNYFPSR